MDFTNTPDERLLVTIPEAARLLSYGVTKTRALIDAGQIRTIGSGRERRVVVASLREFVESAA